MSAALTPALTLDYVHALSADVRAAVVLDAGGECLAGPTALGEAARAVLAELEGGAAGTGSAPAPTLLEGTTDAAAVYAARDERHAIVVVTGPHALSRLTRHDLRSALAALGGAGPIDVTPARLSRAAVRALLSAGETVFGALEPFDRPN